MLDHSVNKEAIVDLSSPLIKDKLATHATTGTTTSTAAAFCV
jgi:hypothetical protein